MADAENTLPSSKKRAAGREISKDNPGLDDEEDSAEQETGTFKRASDEVLATRRIVKVRRNQNASVSSNPFAGIQLLPATESNALSATTNEAVATSEKVLEASKIDSCELAVKDENENAKELEREVLPVVVPAGENQSAQDEAEKSVVSEPTEPEVDNDGAALDSTTEDEKAAAGDNVETEDKKDDGKENGDRGDDVETEDKKDDGKGNADQSAEGTPLSSFQQLSSSQNAFTGLAGTGFSTSTFTFGSLSKDGSGLGGSSGYLFGQRADQVSIGFGLPTNGSSTLFNTAGSSSASRGDGSGFPSKQEITVETGEENDTIVFSADSVLFEFLEGAWKERGKGELKVNVSDVGKGKARLLMRARGNYRLILNANLYPDMKLTNMDKRGITFACVNSIGDGKDSLSTFALKFKDASVVDEFCMTVTDHKGKAATDLKTPENSPKATEV